MFNLYTLASSAEQSVRIRPAQDVPHPAADCCPWRLLAFGATSQQSDGRIPTLQVFCLRGLSCALAFHLRTYIYIYVSTCLREMSIYFSFPDIYMPVSLKASRAQLELFRVGVQVWVVDGPVRCSQSKTTPWLDQQCSLLAAGFGSLQEEGHAKTP